MIAFALLAFQVPKPDLSPLKPVLQAHIIEAQHAVIAALDQATPEIQAEAIGGLGLIYHAHSFRIEAEQAYQIASQTTPHPWSYYLGMIAVETGHLDEAVGYFKTAIESELSHSFASVRLGYVFLDLNRPEDAARAFRQAEKINDAFTLFGLGRAEADMGHFDEAIDLMSKALALQPDATTIHYPLGLAYRRAGNIEKAREHLSQRGDIPISFPDPFLARISAITTTSSLMVVVAMAQEEPRLNVRDFEGYIHAHLAGKQGTVKYLSDAYDFHEKKGTLTDNARAYLHFAMGILSEGHRQLDDAIEHYRQAFRFDNELMASLYSQARIFAKTGEKKREKEVYDVILNTWPRETDARLDRAQVSAELGLMESAIEDLETLLEYAPETHMARLRLAQLQESSHSEDALRAYEQLLSVEIPKDQQLACLAGAARLELRRNQPDQAIGYLKRAWLMAPNDPAIGLQLAAIMATADRYADAIKIYNSVIELDDQLELAHFGRYAAAILLDDSAQALSFLEQSRKALPSQRRLAQLMLRFGLRHPGSLNIGELLALSRAQVDTEHGIAEEELHAMTLALSGAYEQAASRQAALIDAVRSTDDRILVSRLYGNLVRYQQSQPPVVPDDLAFLLPP
ncbi:MAG: tetratricopeptide repeat protein [Acidobacteria bacterium]|nr:tetratricopeptide repeat protein [Acidobacteriota bacterium]